MQQYNTQNMISIAVIPARFAASRFPGKLLQDLGGKTVIRRTYESALATGLFDQVFVVTDSDLIFDEITAYGGQAIMSKAVHESGSDRIAEAVQNIEADVVVNVQGDEPFINGSALTALLDVFKNDLRQEVDLASLMCPIDDFEEIQNPNLVKVVTDAKGFALYFSRAPIPFPRDTSQGKWFQHIGVYAFRKQAILSFPSLPFSMLEATEKLEQLRYLEAGKRIKMVVTHQKSIGIDTEADLIRARLLL